MNISDLFLWFFQAGKLSNVSELCTAAGPPDAPAAPETTSRSAAAIQVTWEVSRNCLKCSYFFNVHSLGLSIILWRFETRGLGRLCKWSNFCSVLARPQMKMVPQQQVIAWSGLKIVTSWRWGHSTLSDNSLCGWHSCYDLWFPS